ESADQAEKLALPMLEIEERQLLHGVVAPHQHERNRIRAAVWCAELHESPLWLGDDALPSLRMVGDQDARKQTAQRVRDDRKRLPATIGFVKPRLQRNGE